MEGEKEGKKGRGKKKGKKEGGLLLFQDADRLSGGAHDADGRLGALEACRNCSALQRREERTGEREKKKKKEGGRRKDRNMSDYPFHTIARRAPSRPRSASCRAR